jgi:hypothetical protein
VAVRTRFVLAITVLSIAHHVDHVLRDVTGWPFEGGFNPFSGSLFVYPVIAAGLFLGAGPRFWATLAGGGAVFVLLVHVGPTAGDAVTDFPDQYGSPVATAVALAVLAALVAGLLAHCGYELRQLRARRV